jgi:TolC family type I secretion outer membrane protein
MRSAARMSASALSLMIATVSSARAESLSDAIAAAYANSPILQGQRAAQQAMDENYVQARSAYGLQVQASVGETNEKVHGHYYRAQSPTGSLSDSADNESLSISQSLYSGGRNLAAVNEAEANILAQRETLRQAETQVLQQVVAAYVGVRRDMASLQVYRDTVLALNRQLKQTEAEFAVRQVTQTDVDESRGRVALAETNAANAQAQLEVSRSQYLQLVGENPANLDPEPALEVFPDLDAAFDAAEANNPGLSNARYQEQAARVRVAKARANYLPSVSAQVQLSRSPIEPYSSTYGNQTAIVAAVTLNQPLYTSGLYSSQVRQALAEENQARAQVEATRRTAIQSVSQAWSQLVAARLSIVSDEAGVAATEAAFYGVRREQPFDLRTPIDVLNAEQELNNAQIRLVEDRYNEYVARVNVLAAAGLLDVQALSPHAPRIRPETSFNKIKGKGLPPWVGPLQALDSIGSMPVPAPRPAVRDSGDRENVKPLLPPPPSEAAKARPLKTATSIMEAEAAEGGQRAGDAPIVTAGHCFHVEGSKVIPCAPGEAPPK